MTEQEVKDLETYMQETREDPEFILAWAKSTLQNIQAQEQKLLAEFLMWKFVRDDARMKSAAESMKTVRACIDYLRKLAPEDLTS